MDNRITGKNAVRTDINAEERDEVDQIFNKPSSLLGACLMAALLMATESPLLYASSGEQLKTMSLEALAQIPVSIATRRPQSVDDSSSAVFVITNEDIRRSGATSIPDVLRMVPGLNVGRIDGSHWAVSARGFNGAFSNKLLVLMDGRTLYTPGFSGTYWGVQDTVLEDIERIEVVRGPGAAAWGSNAVNGVINIITRSAADTQGNLLSVTAGSLEQAMVSVRHGGKTKDDGHFRLFGKYRQHQRANFLDGSTGNDDWYDGRIGFRGDGFLGADDSYTLQGELYRNLAGQTLTTANPTGGELISNEVFSDQGGYLLGRLSRIHTDSAETTLQLYVDTQQRDFLNDKRMTLDIDAQHQFTNIGSHSLLLGGGYRWIRDEIQGRLETTLLPERANHNWFTLYIQDQVTLNEQWRFDLGAMLEHNDYTGFEFQPSARVLWNPAERHTLWAGASRAARTPSRADTGIESLRETIPAAPPYVPLPVDVVARGNTDFKTEVLDAFEIGYRWRSAQSSLSLDATAYYNNYKDLRTIEPQAPTLTNPPTAIEQVILFDNKMDGHSYGLEMAVDWRMQPDWRWQLAYSIQRLNLNTHSDSLDPSATAAEGQTPEQQLSLRSSIDPYKDIEVDLWLRYVDQLDAPSVRIPAYWTADLRIGWQVASGLQLSLVGKDLLDEEHPEFEDELGASYSTQTPRSWYINLRWDFD